MPTGTTPSTTRDRARQRATARGRRIGALVLAAALLAAGCGDDDDDDAGDDAGAGTGSSTPASDAGATETSGTPADGGDAGAGGEVRGVTADSIRVGGLSEVALYSGIEEGARARFERANEEGGVHGRTIDFVGVRDDGSDGARNLDLTRELVGSDEVFAVAPIGTALFQPASSDYLASEQVPFFGYGFPPGFCGNEWGFGFNGCLIGTDFVNSSLLDGAFEAAGIDPAGARIAMLSGDSEFGRSFNQQIAVIADAAGAEIVHDETNYPPDQTVADATPYVNAIMDSDADIALVNLAFASTVQIVGGLQAAGFEGAIFNYITYAPGLLETQPDLAAALDGTYVITQLVPQESGSPTIEQIQSDLEAIGEEPFANVGTQIGWFSADLLLQALEAVGPELTPERLDAVLNGEGFEYVSGEGGLGPVAFPEGHAAAAPCAAIVQVVGSQFEQVVPVTCYENIPAGG